MAKNGTQIRLTKESKLILKRLAKAGKIDLRPSLKVIGIGYRKEVKSIFEKQQPRGVSLRWSALSPKYALWKRKHFPGKPLLVRSGDLKNSMITKGARGNITLIGRNSAVFGSSISYGAFHDDGTRTLPKRNFSEPSERRFNIWRRDLEKGVTEQFRKNKIKVEGDIFA